MPLDTFPTLRSTLSNHPTCFLLFGLPLGGPFVLDAVLSIRVMKRAIKFGSLLDHGLSSSLSFACSLSRFVAVFVLASSSDYSSQFLISAPSSGLQKSNVCCFALLSSSFMHFVKLSSMSPLNVLCNASCSLHVPAFSRFHTQGLRGFRRNSSSGIRCLPY